PRQETPLAMDGPRWRDERHMLGIQRAAIRPLVGEIPPHLVTGPRLTCHVDCLPELCERRLCQSSAFGERQNLGLGVVAQMVQHGDQGGHCRERGHDFLPKGPPRQVRHVVCPSGVSGIFATASRSCLKNRDPISSWSSVQLPVSSGAILFCCWLTMSV